MDEYVPEGCCVDMRLDRRSGCLVGRCHFATQKCDREYRKLKSRRSLNSMKRKCSFKRAAALVLATVMTLGAVPVPGLVHEAHADTEDLPLSTMAYADVDTLLRMSGSSAGDVQKSGRIKLGKDSKGAAMEWIVMGMDIQIDGDNIAVFAGKNLIEHDQYVDRAWQIQKFQNSNTDLII